jgi:hypothetical protein
VAAILHTGLDAVETMTLADLYEWHAEAARVFKLMQGEK